ncbi:tetratricopeptide repeat protein [Herbaspirillum robiniae]|uniref:tetratricopeptide repeat protein n=1 Tax=Herbaspirillum robiniae TaxID=2014887 RepID=UPI001FAEF221|nr:tetratricopeptide repeat protein [Herbaspirillum robiniae]
MTSAPQTPNSRQQGTWYSFNAPYERLRLFSPWTIAGFALAVGTVFALVYPKVSLQQRLEVANASGRADQLTVEYLKVFLRAQPGNAALRAELVKQMIGLGQFAEARQHLALLQQGDDPASRLDAAWLEYRIRQQETYALPEKSPERAAQIAQLRGQLQQLMTYPLTAQQWLALSQDALALGDTEAAHVAFSRLLADRSTASMPYADVVRLGKESLGLGDYRSSASFYLLAMKSAGSLETRRDHFMTALRTLQAGGLYQEALAAADANIGELANDKPTLLFLTKLAQAANRPDAAQRYVKQLLQLSMNLRGTPLAAGQGEYAQVHFQSMRDFTRSLRLTQALLHSPHELRLRMRDAMRDGRVLRTANAVAADARPAAVMARPAGDPSQPSAAEMAASREIARLPFDEEIYTLAFNVFLANRNLDDARLLAQSAVRQKPDSAAWRKRLAEVSEWSGVPEQATPQWLAYARLSNDEAAWDNVLRIAQGTFEQEIVVEALQHKLQVEPGSAKWLNQLVAQYENIGQADRAAALLEASLKKSAGRGQAVATERNAEMDALARLYLRMGRDADALALLRQQRREFGATAGNALLAANQLYLNGHIEDAMSILNDAAAAAPVGNTDFWRAYAEVARFLEHEKEARVGYDKLLASDKADEGDISNMMGVIQDAQPRAAAELAEFGFRRTGVANFAVQALTYRQRLNDLDGAQAFIDSITPQQNAILEKNVPYLTVRATIKQLRRDLAGARADMAMALALRPRSAEVRAELIWILIAGRDTELLKRALDLWAGEAETLSQLWGPFAAANMSLNRQNVALHWFRKSGFPQNDYLWLMSYAEALDATGQPDLAWRIRRRAWVELRDPKVLRNIPPTQLKEWRDRLAALAPLFMQSDAGLRVMQALLKSDATRLAQPADKNLPPADGPALLKEMEAAARRDAGERNEREGIAAKLDKGPDALFAPTADSGQRPRDDARLSSSVRELALAYAMNTGESDLARAWLATRFARELDKPLWGELALALAADDRQGLNNMLDNLADWLPMYDRIEAARVAGRMGLAQTLAFDQLERLPADDELHGRLTNLVTDEPAKFIAGYTSSREFPLATKRFDLSTGFALTPGTRLTFNYTERHQTVDDTTLLGDVPSVDRLFEFSLRRRIEDGFVSVGLQHRDAMQSFNGLRLEFSQQITPKMALSGNGGFNLASTDSALMRVGSKRSGGELNLNVQVSRTEYLRLGGGYQRYTTQAGTSLGSGRTLNIEAGTHFRVEYPNLTLRTYVSDAKFSDNGASDDQIARLVPAGNDPTNFRYMPLDSRIFGISLGAGTVVESNYTRAWRPYAEIGMTRTSDIGWGRNARAGVAGSVIGQDVLSVGVQSTSATPNTPQRGFELNVLYKWLY